MAEEPTSPANQGKWVEKSENKMMQARNLIRDMLTVVRNNEVVEASNKAAMQEADKREKEAKKAVVFSKAAAHEKVIATSFKCMQDIEDGILQTEDSLSKLTHERYRGFAYLQVCERRLELREKRPPAETFQDALTLALTSEKQTLEAARKELLELEEQGKKIVTELRDKRKFLSEDTGIRRLQMMEDLKTLSPQVALPPVKANSSPKNGKAEPKEEKKEEKAEAEKTEKAEEPAEAPEAERPVTAPSHVMTPEEQKKAEQASKELIADTLKLLEKTSCHRNKSLETVFKVKQDTSRANHRSEDCLSRRTAELAEMKKQLEKHALDVEAAILRAERSLERTERRLDVKDNKKVEKFKQDTAMLENLRGIRDRLGEDIRNKFAALEIDNMCRRVTAAKAAETKMKQSLNRTNSAPTLKKSSTNETGAGQAAEGFGDKPPEINIADANNGTTAAAKSSPGSSKSLKAGAAAGLQ
mmetsp:Transcript_126552/g.300560  ORF Transcript_126552/g.300560 Transcript_126552/m.300560 type:complete len:472 (-) Transcript_126552:367-1782(-)